MSEKNFLVLNGEITDVGGQTFCSMGQFNRKAIISDPPYEAERLPLIHFDSLRDSHMLLFCKPTNQFFKADEFLYWYKTPSTKNYKNHPGRFIEFILVQRHPDGPFNCLHWSQMTGVYDDRLIDRKRTHPHQKPLTLLQRIIRIYTNPGDIIIDPYMGSGSMGVAAARLGRKYLGCEIDDERFEFARKRIQEFYENDFNADLERR